MSSLDSLVAFYGINYQFLIHDHMCVVIVQRMNNLKPTKLKWWGKLKLFKQGNNDAPELQIVLSGKLQCGISL